MSIGRPIARQDNFGGAVPLSSIQHQSDHQSDQQTNQQILALLSTLSYRSGELDAYLDKIAASVSQLLASDWSIVTVCQGDAGQIVASSLGLGKGDNGFSLHGTLIQEIVESGRSRVVEDARLEMGCAKPPSEYLGYLGVPLRTAQGESIGTVCSFFHQPRRFSAEAVQFVEILAERAATAIDNYQLYQQQQQFNQALEAEVAQRTQELRSAQRQLIQANEQLEQRIEQRTVELRRANAQLQAEILERKRAEQATARLAEIGELAAMIVHEVRNPLTTILMALTALRGIELPHKMQTRLALGLEDAERLQRLLNEILLYAKPQVMQNHRLELNALLTDFLESIQDIPAARERKIQLRSSLSPAWILGDRDKLMQVLINLIRNACEAVEAGETIACHIELATDPNQVCISIHNSGAAIAPEVLAKLGTPFFTTKLSGNGLGLAIVHRIIKAHQGQLQIQSKPETGTVIRIQLPLVQQD